MFFYRLVSHQPKYPNLHINAGAQFPEQTFQQFMQWQLLIFSISYFNAVKLTQFNLLDQKEQRYYLNANKVFLNDTRTRKYLFKLFQAGEFYVEEIWQRPVNILLSVHCFTSVARLQRYIEVIDVSGLLMFA